MDLSGELKTQHADGVLGRGHTDGVLAVALSPDERLAYIANSFGVARDGAQHSTLQVVDVDEASATFGEVLTRLTNLESRSSEGCSEN